MTDKYLNLTLFSGTNTTGQTGMGQDLSAEMKTYYDDLLIDNAEPNLVHDQFGQKKPIPKNRGKVIEFRRYSQLPKLTTGVRFPSPAPRRSKASFAPAYFLSVTGNKPYGSFLVIPSGSRGLFKIHRMMTASSVS